MSFRVLGKVWERGFSYKECEAMKEKLCLLSSLLAAVIMNVFASEAKPMPLQELIQAAQREGAVVHVETVPSEAWVELEKRFNKRFGTAIKVQQMAIQAAAGVARLREEKAAGKISIDLYRGSGSYTNLLLGAGLLAEPFDFVGTFGGTLPGIEKVTGPPRIPKYLQNRIVIYDDLTKGVVYNKKLVAKNEVPRKWEDLLDPKWKDRKIGVEPGGASTYGLLLYYSKEWTLNFNRKLKDQKPLYLQGLADVADAVDRGEVLIGAGVGIHHVMERQNIDMAPEIPLFSAPRNIMPIKGAPHPNAARLWAAWYAIEGIPILNKEFNIHYGLIDGNSEQSRFAQKLGLKYKFEGLTEGELKDLAEIRRAIQKILTR